ncbi:Gfo/Idh/MocA family oxidoreductase [Paenibacillus tritici]|uniref:Gfo/Idh/MocA family oxidoreductase n=1 Tax=Paenibacillus tritici TaxID=1873425 RepID=UPI001BA446E2|nr:Gfo/Idh/MocA family oxidoreductase [Paenibacillus tritici]QUL53136.1 Gfo/Idh/MocA family oxidoreductase [Paenibacillus tritici]
MNTTKLCFIGAGFHAATNIYPAAVEAKAEIQAVATRSMERSAAALQRFGSSGRPYEDYTAMLENEDCDGVVVVAQPGDQPSLVLDCLRAGKNVYVDKPLGWNAAEALGLAEAAEQAGVVLMVGFMKRYAPVYMNLKQLIDQKSLGAARSFQVKFAVDSTPFCKDEEQFIKLAAIHMVDLIRYLFGEVIQVSGMSGSSGEYISMSLSMKCAGGVVGSIYFSGMSAWSRESESVLVTFDEGFAAADEMNRLTIHRSYAGSTLPWQSLAEEDTVLSPSASAMSGGLRDLYLRGFVGEMEHFMDCCRKGQAPLSSGRDNVQTMELCGRILSALGPQREEAARFSS